MTRLILTIKTFFASLFLLSVPVSHAQEIATLRVELPEAAPGMEIPVSVNLDNITYIADSLLSLFEINGNKKTVVPFQIESGEERTIHWFVTGDKDAGASRSFELSIGKAKDDGGVKAVVSDGSLTFEKNGKNLLRYVFKTVYPPAGVDSSYRRSGFIHPLWSPHGQVLTRIQPPDHYHHYGIWDPWTHVLYEGDTIDFWNLNLNQGTVRFGNFVSIIQGPLFGEFDALQEHVVLKKKNVDKVALNELQSVRVFCPPNDKDYFIVDFNIRLNCANESPVKLLEYRYAGLGWRTTEKWDNKNSMILTSEGKTRKDADGSKARWCIVQGQIDDDYAGVIMMSFPTNYNHPEPLRIWPEDQNGRGDLFANFCPTKNMDWYLSPGQNYVLKYRFLVFNGRIDKTRASSQWYYYANPPRVTVVSSNER
jgi:hypothetical protein